MSSDNLGAILSAIPSCGLNCLVDAITTKSNCSLTDTACSCANQAVQAAANTCVRKSCTIPDALRTQNGTSTLCGIESYHDTSYVPVLYTFFVMSTLFVLIRFASRIRQKTFLWLDDWSIVGSTIICLGFTLICTVYGTRLGVGSDIWTVPQENISLILKLSYIAIILYTVSRSLIRVSITLVYFRIFKYTGAKPVIILAFAINIAITIAYLVGELAACKPMSFYWNRWDGQHQGRCIKEWDFLLAAGVISAVHDMSLVLLPMPLIFQLKSSRRKKLVTAGLFALSLIVLIVSVMRILSLYYFTHTENITQALVGAVIWNALELYVGNICACLPSSPVIFKPIMSGLTSIFTGKGTSNSSRSRSRSHGQSADHHPHPHIHAPPGPSFPFNSSSSNNYYRHHQRAATADSAPDSRREILMTTTIQQQRNDDTSGSETYLPLHGANYGGLDLNDQRRGNVRGQAYV
ncbi:hypothetical protein B0T17DRAFT_352214 [Bombardia bombarda]|uniref:CFEM domain-containing protein n=1 Tax=Bombardia bombarda TaxID=252184 RepID=A0AA39WHZ1_9PEZI|nr:hypothetical protein B0T17DRAFT_352214 [Bombardia bombarda]